MKTFFICLILFQCAAFCQSIEYIEKKYQDKINEIEKSYRSSMIKVKKSIRKDLKSTLKKTMSDGNLATANDLKKEIVKLEKEIEKLSFFSEMKGLTKRLRFDTAAGFYNTGISLKKGQQVKFNIIGSWKPNNELKLDGDGINVPDWSMHNYLKSAYHGKVIAFIDGKAQDFYEVGKRGKIVAKASGMLFIGVNDKDTHNNKGVLKAIINY